MAERKSNEILRKLPVATGGLFGAVSAVAKVLIKDEK